ncbi:MAG: serine hydrolase domain-containing protein [Spirosomataceae bacterium]
MTSLLFSLMFYIGSATPSDSTDQTIQQFLLKHRFPTNTQFAIALVSDQETRYLGYKVQGDSCSAVSNHQAIFEIGSITKVLTSSVLAHFIEHQSLDSKASIQSAFPYTFHKNQRITWEKLANHTSGLPRLPNNMGFVSTQNPYRKYGKEALDQYLSQLMRLPAESTPTLRYSNLGAGVLGHALSLHAGKSLSQLYAEIIFQPLGMTRTYTSPQAIPGDLVLGLNEKGEIFPNWDFDVLLGAGGILSSVEDIARFAQAQWSNQHPFLLRTHLPTHRMNEKQAIGLGWFINYHPKGEALLWHNGGTGGYGSFMVVNLEKKKAVVILSNVSGLSSKRDLVDQLGLTLLN